MNNTYSFLFAVKAELKDNQRENIFFLPFLLMLLVVMLPLGVSNVAMGFFLAFVIFHHKRLRFTATFSMISLILLFLWMAISITWTIDVKRTSSAIPKELILLLLPISFMMIPGFTAKNKKSLLKYYSYSVVVVAIFFIVRAGIRYIFSGDTRTFFYHGEYDDDFGLVPKVLNAIHVSVFAGLAFCYFLSKKGKQKADWFSLMTLLAFIVLLSSKNVIVTIGLLTGIYLMAYAKLSAKLKLGSLAFRLIFIVGLMSIPKIQNRFMVEINTMFSKPANDNVDLQGVKTTSVYEAWHNEKFSHADYLSGTALRVYQTRMFFELFSEHDVFWQGFGLNASRSKLLEKEKQYNLYPGYGKFNFHNQYIQNFAELGLIGFILLLIPLTINIKNAIRTKDFVHIAFAILMVSVFVTESFLWRQRGVTFFVLFYCMFNTTNTLVAKKELWSKKY